MLDITKRCILWCVGNHIESSIDGDDLERLGYTQYRGGNRENVYKVTWTTFLSYVPGEKNKTFAMKQTCFNQCHISQVSDPVHGEEGEIPLNEMRLMIQR